MPFTRHPGHPHSLAPAPSKPIPWCLIRHFCFGFSCAHTTKLHKFRKSSSAVQKISEKTGNDRLFDASLSGPSSPWTLRRMQVHHELFSILDCFVAQLLHSRKDVISPTLLARAKLCTHQKNLTSTLQTPRRQMLSDLALPWHKRPNVGDSRLNKCVMFFRRSWAEYKRRKDVLTCVLPLLSCDILSEEVNNTSSNGDLLVSHPLRKISVCA